ncbi:MAG: sugar transferase [Candidatus Omnitrophica bacterium]|nr:sugar transferase [Candidatus Omnitrophota bacterium]
MLRRQREIYVRVQKLIDAGLFGLAFWLAHLARSNWKIEIFGGTAEIPPFHDLAWLLLVVFPLGPILLQWHGYYNRPLMASRRLIAWQLFESCILTTVSVILVMFLRKVQLTRAVIILFPLFSFGLIMSKEQLLWLKNRWAKGQSRRHFILVGTSADNKRFRPELAKPAFTELELVAQLNLDAEPVENLVELLHEYSANGVIINAKHVYFSQIEKAIQVCELEGVEAWLLADFFKTQISKTILDDFADRPMLIFRSTPEESWQALAKQVMDVGGAAFLLLILSPLILLVASLIKISSPGPVLFRQLRSGLNGQPFMMLKFRSMVSDAEQLKHELEVLNEMSGPVFKISDDPRITAVGRWLRRYSIDELPQLWNVLRGEMSLVGPRPLPVDEVKRFDDLSHRRRLSVKPGLTCKWQVSGRNNVTDFDDWVRLDLEYIDNWSLWLDFKILFQTIPAVIYGTGAK